MIATGERPEQRVVLHAISWEAYETLVRETGENHVRLTYDDGDLEIMTLSFAHENAGEWLGRLIFFLALQLQPAGASDDEVLHPRLPVEGADGEQVVASGYGGVQCPGTGVLRRQVEGAFDGAGGGVDDGVAWGGGLHVQ